MLFHVSIFLPVHTTDDRKPTSTVTNMLVYFMYLHVSISNPLRRLPVCYAIVTKYITSDFVTLFMNGSLIEFMVQGVAITSAIYILHYTKE